VEVLHVKNFLLAAMVEFALCFKRPRSETIPDADKGRDFERSLGTGRCAGKRLCDI
jgi:hypothetical protein